MSRFEPSNLPSTVGGPYCVQACAAAILSIRRDACAGGDLMQTLAARDLNQIEDDVGVATQICARRRYDGAFLVRALQFTIGRLELGCAIHHPITAYARLLYPGEYASSHT